MKIGKKRVKTINLVRDDVHRFLYDAMNETLNEGLPYDDAAKKEFSKEEFDDLLSDYKLYGNLFGLQFITKLMNKLDTMVKNNFNELKEKEEK